MGSDKKGKKQEKGSVGFVGNGALKVGTARLFWSSEKEPNDIKEEMQKHYGAGVRVKYVSIVDPEEYYDKLKEKLSDKLNGNTDIVLNSSSCMQSVLKEVTGANQVHNLKSKDGDGDDDKEEEEEDDDEKKSKKASSSKKGKKDDDEEDEAEEDDKPSKSKKADTSNKKGKKDDDEGEKSSKSKKANSSKKVKKADEEEEDDEDEAPSDNEVSEDDKKKAKKGGKSDNKKLSK